MVVTASLEGRTLGDFVVRERIGHGAFGAVHRAEQLKLGREAVIKVLHGEHQADGRVTQRFLREARLASRLDHPYAAHVYAFGVEEDGLLWIAMELVRGTSLAELLRTRGAMTLDRFVPLFDRICEVVEGAHAHGIVHRDLKPANVMVRSFAGRLIPKLLDFGIAKGGADDEGPPETAATGGTPRGAEAMADTMDTPVPSKPASSSLELEGTADAVLTGHGATLGSPHYMAPEQWVNAAAVGPPADIYALGIVAYEALTGSPPFAGQTLMAIARSHANRPVPPLGERFPPAVDETLTRALAKKPEDRYPSALALGAAFRAASGLGGPSVRVPRLEARVADRWLAEAPQPIADALAVLDSAKNLDQAASAEIVVCATLARWIGLVALASRAQIGDGGDTGEAVSTRLRELRHRDLPPEEWVALAREVVRPFAEVSGAFPLPELVAFFFAPDGKPGPGQPLFDALLGRHLAGSGNSDDFVNQFLIHALADLTALLDALGFFCDYALVVPRPGGRLAGVPPARGGAPRRERGGAAGGGGSDRSTIW